MEFTKIKVISTEGKTRKWHGYHNSNTYNEADCQLITACNAYYHLTGKFISKESDLYKKMVKDSMCLYGSCIDITKAWKILGIYEDITYPSVYDISNLLKSNNFFELRIWYKRYGFHSIAAIDYNKKCDALRVTNIQELTSVNGWVFIEDLKPHITTIGSSGWVYRTFKLV